MMRALRACGLLLVLAGVQGCAGEAGSETGTPPASAVVAPHADEDKAVTRRPARTYEAIPEHVLGPAAKAVSGRSRWAWVQSVLASGSLPEAGQAHADLKREFPNETEAIVSSGLQLAHAMLAVSPMDVRGARALLADLAAAVEQGSAARWRDDHARMMAIVELADGAAAIAGEPEAFAGWMDGLRNRMVPLFAPGGDLVLLPRALAHLISSVQAEKVESAARLDRLALMLETDVAWHSLAALRALHAQRVQVLLQSGQAETGVVEGRILLALTCRDARAWPAVLEQVARLLAAAGKDAAEVERFREFQVWGPRGADGRPGTADDLIDLPAAVPFNASRQSASVAVAEVMADRSTADLDRAIRAGVQTILAGEAAEAIEHFRGLIRAGAVGLDAQHTSIMNALCVATALADGHGLHCERMACELLNAQASDAAGPVWRHEADRCLERRAAFIGRLIEDRQAGLTLGLCRAVVEEDAPADRIRAGVKVAWSACQSLGGSDHSAALTRFREFGKGLGNPRARVCQTRLCGEMLRRAGQHAAVLEEIEGLKDIWDEAKRDPVLVLLYASGLVSISRSAEALEELESLCARADLPPEISWRAQLVLGVAYVQEGRPATARWILSRLLGESPSREYRGRVVSILRKIQM